MLVQWSDKNITFFLYFFISFFALLDERENSPFKNPLTAPLITN